MRERPQLGVFIFLGPDTIQPAELARAVEERGLDSLWVTEHTHIPTSRESPYPGGGELPPEYRRTYDPFVALAAAATVTERIRLATGICLVAEHDPVVLAKSVATLDRVSGGRVVLGVGGGWNAEELRTHGVAFRERWAVVRERVLCMRRLWTDEVAAFHGDHVELAPAWAEPKPVQPGGPPVIVGSSAKRAFGWVAEWGDGWLPIYGTTDLVAGRAALDAAAEAAGRDPASLSLSVYGVPRRAELAAAVAELGVADRLIFPLPSRGRDEVLTRLDACADVARALGST